MENTKPKLKYSYRHTQQSLPALIVLGVILLFLMALIFAQGIQAATMAAFLFVAFCLVNLLTFTTEVGREKIHLYFGPGLVRTSVPLAKVCNLRVVGPGSHYGGPRWLITSHWLFSLWFYNISGMEAVEIEMRNGYTFRVGSDEPAELAKAIENALIDLRK